MFTLDQIKARRSVRTFDGRALTEEDRNRLFEFAKTIENPYGIPVEFVYLDAAEHGLSSPVIKGEKAYIAGKVPNVRNSEVAYGYSFEQLVLYAWTLGIGTTWMGATMKRPVFEKAADVKDGEQMYCVTPVGYPASKMALKEIAMRKGVKADTRKAAEEMFFEGGFTVPLKTNDAVIRDALESVRFAPSAVNKQPWKIVKSSEGNAYHFYIKHDKGYDSMGACDLQLIDMGIALYHFIMMTGGTFSIEAPGFEVPDKVEYIATVTV